MAERPVDGAADAADEAADGLADEEADDPADQSAEDLTGEAADVLADEPAEDLTGEAADDLADEDDAELDGFAGEPPAGNAPDAETDEKPPEVRARTRALRLLARREKSRRGLGVTLTRAGFSADVIRGVLDDLEREGIVDDLRYCRLYLGEQARSRPRSARLLRHDLRREGIDPGLIERAFADMAEEIDESGLATAAARKKLRTAGKNPDRLRRLLRARGFSHGAIEEALRAVLPTAAPAGDSEDGSPD